MNILDYFTIVERNHTYQNPTSEAKLDRLIEYCKIADGQRILDVGCGKGWLLQRIAERFDVQAEGIEVNPPFLEAGKARIARAALRGEITFHQMPASGFEGEAESYDVGLCIGASFAIGTFEDMVAWLRKYVRPGGFLAIGDVYARREAMPPQSQEAFGGGPVRSFADTATYLDRDGLTLIGVIDSSLDEWDRYESLHWRTADEWADAHPDHPDRNDFLEQTERMKTNHLRFDRESLGWAMFVSRVG